MRYLLISISFILLFSCGSYTKKYNLESVDIKNSVIQNPYFSSLDKDYVYKANIEVYDNTFGGLFIVKKISKVEHRIVFTTEMGNKLFDFSYKESDFKVNSILEALDRKILINILEKDFRVLITENLNTIEEYATNNNSVYKTILNKKPHYYYKKEYLNKIINAKGGKEKIIFTFSEISDNIAKKIEIKHNNIKLKINLKSIN
ncbi:hypothetical protein [uncultured Lacinutrix sp.]|uniref:hypothetical protein n=1 Tax=uncultured Lacinutrix sp. TaxID=574032 RepID=UPI0026225F62|nr:hypothetical protein [uncultured Lacinutrix sp.]